MTNRMPQGCGSTLNGSLSCKGSSVVTRAILGKWIRVEEAFLRDMAPNVEGAVNSAGDKQCP